MQEKPGSPVSVPATLGLNHTEERIIARLISQGCLSREQICALATRAHQSIKLGSVNAIINNLRKKLRACGIEVRTVFGFGFELHPRDRAKIVALIGPREPTNPIRTSPTGATDMEPEERPDAA
jgi:hypothetical protein